MPWDSHIEPPTTPEAVSEAMARLLLPTTAHIGQFIAREIDLERQRMERDERERGRDRGVCWSGLGSDRYVPRTAEQIAEAASDKAVRDEAFWNSPRGVFVKATNALMAGGGYAAEANRARAAYSRGFADEAKPPCPREIANALLALNEVPTRDGILAREALAELLLGRRAEAA